MDPTTSPYIEVNSSGIHNKGIFAKQDIPAETKIIQYVGKLIPKDVSEDRADEIFNESTTDDAKGAVYIFKLNNKFDIDGSVDYNTARFINHTCSPNCEAIDYDGEIWICARRKIKQGEELSYDYGYDIDEYKLHPCKCGKPNCVGYIVSKDKWRALKKKLEKEKRKNRKSSAKNS